MHYGLIAILIISFGILTRLMPHAPNIAAIGALMLFGGAYLPKKLIFIPFLPLIISDFIIGFYGIDMFYVYGSYLITLLLGYWVRFHKTPFFVLGGSLLSSILFFIITNFGVWAPPNNWYPHNISGLIQSYTLAIPFFRNSLLGDLGYTILLFGGYELAQRFSRKFMTQKLFQLLY